MESRFEINNENRIRRIRIWTTIMIIGLFLSGLTAIPILLELRLFAQNIHLFPEFMKSWILFVNEGISGSFIKYPFLAYGTDWLAFAHFMFSILFVGVFIKPVQNIWIVQFGLIACFSLIPYAFITGHFRDIPIFWRIIDGSFGLIGSIPLFIILKHINKLKSTTQELPTIKLNEKN